MSLINTSPWGPIGWLACALFTLPPAVHAQAARETGLRAIQTVTGITQPASTLTSEHVTVNFGGSKSAQTTNASAGRGAVADARPMAVSVREYGVGTMTKAEIIQAAKAIMSLAKAQQIAGVIKGVMAQGKVGSGVFIYEQEVRPKGANREMKLSWGVTVTENGHVLAGDPKVTDADPTTVYMLYTSLAAEAGLPQTWTYADAGVLKWQLRKRDGSPVTAWTTVNTGGAFDETTDSEFKVNCLANNTTAACPAGFVDAKTLMTETASAAAVIDYVRKVTPVYDELLDSATNQIIYEPQMAVSYDRREYTLTGCSGSYRNIGRRGYNLKTTVDRYQILESDTSATRINRFEGANLSPIENFDISKTLNNSSRSLRDKVLNSHTNEVVDAASIRGLQYLSPISTFNTLQNDTNIQLLSTQSDMSMRWIRNNESDFSLYFGTQAINQWAGVNGPVFDRSMNFNISNKDIYTKFSLSHISFRDFILVQINGQTVTSWSTSGNYEKDRLELMYGPLWSYSGELSNLYAQTKSNTRNFYYEPLIGNPWLSPSQFSVNLDLRPYLRAGANSIFLRTIVGVVPASSRGEATIRIDTTSCLAD